MATRCERNGERPEPGVRGSPGALRRACGLRRSPSQRSHPSSRSNSVGCDCSLHWHSVRRRSACATAKDWPEPIKLGEEYGLPQAKANALIFLGWALTCSGESEDGLARLEEGFEVLSRS